MLILGDWSPGCLRVDVRLDSRMILANLEGPLLPGDHRMPPAAKAGPHLFSCHLPEVNGRVVFSLANNHSMDFGMEGLDATRVALRRGGFLSAGAGSTLLDARQPIVVEDEGVRIGIIACCEAQFGVARRNQGGVAEFGPWIYRAIHDLREAVGHVIVSVHAAVEESPWPSPYIRELYHSFVDAGASVVHGHHSHIPQGYEVYGDGVIVYGMGNLAVDPARWKDYPNGMWSLGVELDFGVKPMRWNPITVEVRRPSGSEAIVIEQSSGEEHAGHAQYLDACNRPFGDPELYDALWHEVALRVFLHHGAEYMRLSALPREHQGRQIRAGLSLLKNALLNRCASPSRPHRQDYLLWYHMIACESHRQMLATALGVLAGEIPDLRTGETRQLVDHMMPWSKGVVPA